MEFVDFVNNYAVQHQIILSTPYVICVISQIAFNVSIFIELIKTNYSKTAYNVNPNSSNKI